ncbi:LytR/AlgR family response regulator transcription factor [Pseudofulvibacter geojedonensis]|uniref:LytR/AlgR family response regulator transcription factor n=1 Tax=Pseudofulvibacter geojedonensis TaxID=1123758 RepID=A0ABW3I3M6_9FLAO
MNTTAKILIVEDEYITAKSIANFLSSQGYTIVGCALNINEALNFFKEEEIDCVILDVNLNDDKDGIWLGTYIQENYQIPFIYLTAYTDHKTLNEAINTSPYGFLNKPFQKSELFSSIEIALLKHNSLMRLKEKSSLTEREQYIYLKNIDKFEKVLWKDIRYIESQKNYLFIHTKQLTYKHRETIKEFIKVLPNKKFIQVHRAFIVNLDQISSYKKSVMEIEIENNKIPVSKSYKADLIRFIESK